MYDVILTCNYSPWSSYRGGGQKSTHMIASALAAQGLRVCVVYSKGIFERIVVPENLPYDIRWALFIAVKPGISSPLRFLNGIPFFFTVRALSTSRTVLHGNGDEAALLGWIKNKKRFVYSHRYPAFPEFMHRTRWETWRTRLSVLFREPRFSAIAMALRGADVVACTSRSSAATLDVCFQVPRDKVRVIPNGIDPAFLDVALSGPAAHGVVYYGRLTQAKGVDILLRAYAALPLSLRLGHPLTIIGDGPYAEELRALADTLGLKAVVESTLRRHALEGRDDGAAGSATGIRWIPWLDSPVLALALAAHRVAALPSREESFGNTMLETLATGTTLVTARAGSIPEVVGDQAVLVAPDDVDGLRDALAQALAAPHDPARALARREYVRARYSWAKTAEMYRETYGEN